MLFLRTVCLLLMLVMPAVWAAKPVTLMGMNGRQATFSGVLEARPEGLVLLTREGEQTMNVPWAKFDMLYLEERQPKIYEASVEARSFKRTVPLNLGIYEQYSSYEQCLAKLAEELDKPYKVSVPTYEDYARAYEKYYFHSSSDYENYARARRKLYEDYREFLNDFFRDKDISLDVVQSTYSGNIYSADPDKNTVKITARDVLAYFARESNPTRKEAMAYIQGNRNVLERPLTILKSMQKKVPNPLFDKSNADEIYFETLLENNIRDLEHLNTEKSFPHSATRNFQRLLVTLERGKN